MSIIKSGRLWPYAIGLAITGVFGLCVWTIVETSKADIQPSDDYMTKYQDADANANKLIKQRIAFDKAYKLKFVSDRISENGSDVKYALTTKEGKAVKGAKMILEISRPEVETYTKTIKDPLFEEGLYVFHDVKFPKTGVWNLLLKVDVGDKSRFYAIKTDTRIINDRSIQEASQY
ncbi:FixH family protein [Sulfurimonas sp. SWIR-19]|uniref:FixH family protein n=1 Tax=Sulfurimonas sp. SWIR-19 TaxID=2878390 RepID=UPI001CF1C75A|nr:FixH family protein [Sulfurimonas sp. SWIR-19]UCN00079.1 FixH family protein [Sulfurimonas sp. SWIR-19]